MEEDSSESEAPEDCTVCGDNRKQDSDDISGSSLIARTDSGSIEAARELDDSFIVDSCFLMDIARELDESFSVEHCHRVPVRKELSYPHAPMSLEEVSLVKSLDLWSNRNVRIIGKVLAEGGVKNLVSVAEKGGPYMIRLDTSLLDADPPENITLQMFGELEIISNIAPPTIQLKAKLFRYFDSVDLCSYNKSVQILKEFVPLFVFRNT